MEKLVQITDYFPNTEMAQLLPSAFLFLAFAQTIISSDMMQELTQLRREQTATCEVSHMVNH